VDWRTNVQALWRLDVWISKSVSLALFDLFIGHPLPWSCPCVLVNGLLSPNSATLKQALHANLKLVPRAKTSWALDTSRAFEGLQGCDTYTQAFLQGLPICFSDFTTDLRFRTWKVWRGIAYMNPLESGNKLVTCYSWFACPLLDLQADSHTHVRNAGALLMPPRYLHLDLPKIMLWGMWAGFACTHTHAVESSIWRGGNGHCHSDKCSCAADQNEVHVVIHCQNLFVCSLRRKHSFLFFPFCQSFLWRPLIFHMPCLVRLSLVFFLYSTINSAISFRTLWTIFYEDQQQANQPNDLAGS